MFEYEIEIDKPIDEVYRAFKDPENLPRWLSGLQRTEQVSGEPGEVGSVSKQIYLERGRIVEMTETVTAHEPGRLFAGTLETQGMTAKLRVEFDGHGDTTTVRFQSDFEPDSFMMSVMLPVMRGKIRKRQEGDLQTFKRMLEAGELRI